MNLIVAVDNNWGIGYNGNLLFTIPEDLQNFKKLTLNKVVVMGHDTLKSLPGSKVLKGRDNIVLSRNKDLVIDGAKVCNSTKELLLYLSQYNSDDVFVIGGQQIYEQLLNDCKFAYVTLVNDLKRADKYFPNLDKLVNWEKISVSDVKSYNQISFVYSKFQNLEII